MILRTSEPDPPDNKTVSLFVTSEDEKDFNYIKSLINDLYLHVEKQGGKKLPRKPDPSKKKRRET
jgi:hypothetical protein